MHGITSCTALAVHRLFAVQGDNNLRSSYSRCMQQLLKEEQARPVQQILDVGASTGLSSLALLAAFPAAEVTGVRWIKAMSSCSVRSLCMHAMLLPNSLSPPLLASLLRPTLPGRDSTLLLQGWTSVRICLQLAATCSGSGSSSAQQQGSHPSSFGLCTQLEKTHVCPMHLLTLFL